MPLQIGNDVLLLRNYLVGNAKRDSDRELKLGKLAADVKDLMDKGAELRAEKQALQSDLTRSEERNKELEASLAEERTSNQHRTEEDAAEKARLQAHSLFLERQLDEARREAAMAKDRSSYINGLLEAAKREALEAVPKFRASDEFTSEVREAAVDSFLKGFRMCREKVGAFFPQLDLSAVVVGGRKPGSEGRASGTTQATLQAAPAAAPTDDAAAQTQPQEPVVVEVEEVAPAPPADGADPALQ